MSENITINPAAEQTEGLETRLVKEVLAHILKDWLYEPMHGTIDSRFIQWKLAHYLSFHVDVKIEHPMTHQEVFGSVTYKENGDPKTLDITFKN